MSRSEAKTRTPMRDSGKLVVEAPLGADISVTDGGFSRVAEGVTRLDTTLPEGVYTVRWSAGERGRRWIVRLRGGATLHVPGDLGTGTAEGLPEDARLQAVADLIANHSRSARTSAILVVVLATDAQTRADLGRSVRLRSVEGTLMRRRDRERERTDADAEAADWTMVRYDVPPGPFLVSFETFERRVVEQTVFAIPGRATTVLLSYAQTSLVEKTEGDARLRKRRGVDPSRTVMVSFSADQLAEEMVAAISIAEILLHKLRTRTATLHPSVAVALYDNKDPYLHLYAAAAVVARPGTPIERLASTLNDDRGRLGGPNDEATALYRRLAQFAEWPDVRCLGWRLAADRTEQVAPEAGSLTAAPMLEIAWRWASGQSVRDWALAVDPLIAATANKADPTAIPWLVTGTASKRQEFASPVHVDDVDLRLGAVFGTTEFASPGQVDDVAPDLVRLVEFLTKMLRVKEQTYLPSDFAVPTSAPMQRRIVSALGLSSVGPAAGQLIEAILGSGSTERWINPDSALVRNLASSLGTPLSSLAPTVKAAAREVYELFERDSAGESTLLNSDPHKGRFGGSPSAAGATLSLECFEKSGSLEFLALTLVVTNNNPQRPLRGPVTFHLHPTFTPSLEIVRAIDGRATFVCYAWGGFTVGAETDDGRRMELDLAKDDRLPRWFLER
jgi:hypothetical protein